MSRDAKTVEHQHALQTLANNKAAKTAPPRAGDTSLSLAAALRTAQRTFTGPERVHAYNATVEIWDPWIDRAEPAASWDWM